MIDATGATVESLPTFTGAVMNTNVALLDGATFYVRFGDWFAWGMTLFALLIVSIRGGKPLRSGTR